MQNLQSASLPASLTSIGESAFCSANLTGITIPSKVNHIGNEAFLGCDKLKTVSIPAGVTSIGIQAFSTCISLTAITVASGNPSYKSADGVLFTKAGDVLLQYPSGKSGSSYTVPTAVRELDPTCFAYNDSLKTVTLPSGLTKIRHGAFCGCENLGTITIPASVQTIEFYVFSACSGLTAINVASGNPSFKSTDGVLLTKSGDKLLTCPAGKTGSYSIPSGVKVIYDDAFYCSSLTSVTIPTSVTTIGDWAFADARLTAVKIPASVTTIGEWAFYYCDELKTATLSEGLRTISPRAFLCCYDLGSITIPYSVQSIGAEAFVSCSSMKKAVVLNQNTAIGEHAFGYIDNEDYDIALSGSFSLYGFANSKIAAYAANNGIPFHAIGKPAITKQPANVTVSAGATGSFAVTASNYPKSYQWQVSKDGGVTWSNCTSAGGKQATFTFTAAESYNGWRYRCVVTNGAGSARSNAVKLTVNGSATAKPVITKQPYSQTVDLNKTVTFSVSATGGGLSYQWQKSTDGGKTWSNCSSTGYNMANFSFQAKTTFNGWQYRCKVTNSKGSVTSAPAKLLVNTANPFMDVKPGDSFYNAVLWAYYHNPQITNGTDEMHFSPNALVQRGQAVTFLWRAKNCPEPGSAANPFVDVKSSHYFYQPVLWAVEKNITNGTDETHFSPSQTCSIAQIITFLYRAMTGSDLVH